MQQPPASPLPQDQRPMTFTKEEIAANKIKAVTPTRVQPLEPASIITMATQAANVLGQGNGQGNGGHGHG